MRRSVRRPPCLLAVIACGVLAAEPTVAFAAPGGAASAPAPTPAAPTPAASHLAVLTVDLWADYDQPSMLVMLECELPRSAKLPATFELRIPAAAGKPHAVAQRGAQRRLYLTKYQRTVQGAVATLAVTTEQRVFRVEYYAPLVVQGVDRRFRFEWPQAPKIDLLRYTIQLPLAAKDFKTVPEAEKLWRDSQGMTYRMLAVGAHEAGKPIRLDVSYTSATGELSAELVRGRSVAPPMPVAPPSPTGGAPQPQKGNDGSQKWLLLGLLALAVVFVGFMARGKGRQGP